MGTKLRLADYLVQLLVQHGIQHTFLVTGGGAMHLNDAFGRAKGMTFVPCHHEQACAIAAEAYYRMSGRMAAVNVTTGPGGTNAITGVWGAHVDSQAMIVISGQVKFETVVRSTPLPLRQLGDQEIDIARLVAPITKYAVMVTDPQSIRYHVERALHVAQSGRPGPTWIDVPMNVQGALIDPDTLPGYDPKEDAVQGLATDLEPICRDLIARFEKAERPVLHPGSGVRLAGLAEDFLELAERLGAPVATAFNAHDLIWEDHPLHAGRPGTIGDRAGNFAVQNADLLLVLGCRLNIRQISYGFKNFARAATKVMVDIDDAELKKPTLAIDLPIHADLRDFMRTMLALVPKERSPRHAKWAAWCKERRAKYPVVSDEQRQSGPKVNPYAFIDALFSELPEGAKVVTGDGTACVVSFQAGRLKRGQRLFSNSGSAPMGYDLPAAIGASVAVGRGEVVCLAGDGSIQMNLQELQTILTQRLPVKLFVLNNEGYHSIRQTQRNYFPDNPVGYDAASGIGFPDFGKLAAAYGYPFRRIESVQGMREHIRAALQQPGAQFVEVMLDPEQAFSPKTSSRKLPDGRMVSAPLEDMAPFLPREEFAQNMFVPPPPEER
ncbi:MAG: thiamine pyrophosphate-binding protein [Deltaproteobacteria bacterium]|nr:thiamine pyrophosphate-binding protein [Deltaproteobacteria bacterium]